MRSLPGPHGDFPGLYTARPLNRNLQAAQYRKVVRNGPSALQSQEKPLHVKDIAGEYDSNGGKLAVGDVGEHAVVCGRRCLEEHAAKSQISTYLELPVHSHAYPQDKHVPGSVAFPYTQDHYGATRGATDQGFWEGEHKEFNGILVEPDAPHLRKKIEGAPVSDPDDVWEQHVHPKCLNCGKDVLGQHHGPS